MIDLDSSPEATKVTNGVAVRRDGQLAQVVLSRPEVRNALDLAMWRQVASAFDQLASVEQYTVIILRGAGGNLSAGSDITQFPDHRTGIAAADEYNAAIGTALTAVMRVPHPVIAMISGLAVGGGCELACAADLRVASSDARLGIPIRRLGVSVGPTEVRALLRVLGPARLKDLLLTGRLVDAHEAHRIGLVDRVVPPAQLAEATLEIARQIAAGAPLAAVANKLTIDALTDGTLDELDGRLRELTVTIYEGPDLQEGIRAFVEKRDPVFRQQIVPAAGKPD